MKKNILCVLFAAVLALMPLAGMAVEEPVVMLAGKEMKPGDVLYCNGATVDFSLSDYTGYAELSADGKTLTLNNFDNNGCCYPPHSLDSSSLIIHGPVSLNLQGQNKLSNTHKYGEGISLYSDLTIKGTGSLEIDAAYGIYDWRFRDLTITSGDLTIKGQYDNITTGNFTITGGKVDLISDSAIGLCSAYDLTISGGTVNVSGGNYYGIYSSKNVNISGGEVNSKGVYALNAEKELQLTGGKITVTSLNEAIKANKIICTLPIPEGVEIRSVDDYEMMDYTENLDQYNTDQWNPQWRTFQLPYEPAAPAAPAVPTTGDNASIALWAALAVMSAAGMMVIRRKRTV